MRRGICYVGSRQCIGPNEPASSKENGPAAPPSVVRGRTTTQLTTFWLSVVFIGTDGQRQRD